MSDYNPGYKAFLNLYLHLCYKYICTKFKEDKTFFFKSFFCHLELEDFETRKALSEENVSEYFHFY